MFCLFVIRSRFLYFLDGFKMISFADVSSRDFSSKFNENYIKNELKVLHRALVKAVRQRNFRLLLY